MPRMFYGIEYAYGCGIVNNGPRADKVHQFATVAERDRWASDGPASLNDSGYREAAAARHPLVRKAQRAAELGLEWPQAV